MKIKMTYLVKIMIAIVLAFNCPQLVAEPQPVYGNTYEVTVNPPDGMTQAQYDQSLQLQNKLAGAYPNIKITFAGGVIKLEGDAESKEQILQMVEMAASQPGVTDVDVTGVKISAAGISDEVITAKVKGAYTGHKLFGDTGAGAFPIQIATKHGVVTLSGTVGSQDMVDQAIVIASKVPGVTNVISEVKVEQVLK
ncbi:MAG: BON domain-containing protein [Gammaproteobacteria bacterium]